jgi:hypothetical protein
VTDDPKSPVAAILMKLNKKPEGEGPAAPPPQDDLASPGAVGESDPLGLVAEDLISAVKTGDVEGVKSALQAAFQQLHLTESEE